MDKMSTLFKRAFKEDRVVKVLPELSDASLEQYIYEMEMPHEYAAIFSTLASSANLTVEELILQYLRYAASHPEELRKWKADYDALPESEKQEYDRIKVKLITAVYDNDLWIRQHGDKL